MSDSTIDEKYEALRRAVRETGGLAIAFSGGVDSTFLAAVAHDVLAERAVAITALSPTYAAREQAEARELAKRIGIRQIEVKSNELEVEGFAQNPHNRCYFCKSELYQVVQTEARKQGLDIIADGNNADDVGGHRPGMKAAREAGVMHPLVTTGLTKDDIRELSRRLGLPTAEKPALACLSSRFAYGNVITDEKLKAVDRLESHLRELGFRQLRVRHHGQIARIEVEPEQISRLCQPEIRERLVAVGKEAGFIYVSVDLEGFRSGSMNEALSAEELEADR